MPADALAAVNDAVAACACRSWRPRAIAMNLEAAVPEACGHSSTRSTAREMARLTSPRTSLPRKWATRSV